MLYWYYFIWHVDCVYRRSSEGETKVILNGLSSQPLTIHLFLKFTRKIFNYIAKRGHLPHIFNWFVRAENNYSHYFRCLMQQICTMIFCFFVCHSIIYKYMFGVCYWLVCWFATAVDKSLTFIIILLFFHFCLVRQHTETIYIIYLMRWFVFFRRSAPFALFANRQVIPATAAFSSVSGLAKTKNNMNFNYVMIWLVWHYVYHTMPYPLSHHLAGDQTTGTRSSFHFIFFFTWFFAAGKLNHSF